MAVQLDVTVTHSVSVVKPASVADLAETGAALLDYVTSNGGDAASVDIDDIGDQMIVEFVASSTGEAKPAAAKRAPAKPTRKAAAKAAEPEPVEEAPSQEENAPGEPEADEVAPEPQTPVAEPERMFAPPAAVDEAPERDPDDF